MHEERPGLRLKERPEDFRVEERLAFAPSGTGEHLYLFVEKTGLQTEELAARLALRFSVARRDVGYAGRKDRRAVTRQWFSVPTRTEPEAAALWTIGEAAPRAISSLTARTVDDHGVFSASTTSPQPMGSAGTGGTPTSSNEERNETGADRVSVGSDWSS